MTLYIPAFGSCDPSSNSRKCLGREANTPCSTNKLPKEDRCCIEKWRKKAPYATPSLDAICMERFFSEYCKERNVICNPIPRESSCSPDFLIYLNGHEVAVETKFRSPWRIQEKAQDWASTQTRNADKQLCAYSEKGILTLLVLFDYAIQTSDVIGSVVRHHRRINFEGSAMQGSRRLSGKDPRMEKSLESISAIACMKWGPTLQGAYRGYGVIYPVGIARNKWLREIGKELFEDTPDNGYYLGDTIWV